MLLKKILVIFTLILIYSAPSPAQEKWEWPEHPTNIKVLPAGLSAEQLRAAMHDFTEGLGVRCIFCHKGAEGKPFTEWDFASDENPHKQTAREMIRMLYDIDDHLAKINTDDEQRIGVTCYTCHHGRPEPKTLEAEITEVYHKKGLEPAIAHLEKLKKDYYGKGVYNFESDEVLSDFGKTLIDDSKTEEALRVFKLNTEKFPDSSRAWSSLAQGYLKNGNNQEAIKSFEKALALNPGNRFAKEMLEKLNK